MIFEHTAAILMGLPRVIKKFIALLVDVSLCFFSSWAAFSLRFDEFVSISNSLILTSLISAAIAIATLAYLGAYKTIHRFVSWNMMYLFFQCLFLYSIVFSAVIYFSEIPSVPRSVIILQPLILFLCIGFVRYITKKLLSNSQRNGRSSNIFANALIYGAGSAGRQVAAALRQSDSISPVAFIDDNDKYWRTSINGLPVYSPSCIPQIINSTADISEIFLAMPAISKSRQKHIIQSLAEYPIRVSVLPSVSQLANRNVTIDDIKKIEIEDVLGREPVDHYKSLISKNITNKVVLVTGAGGSIGSELSRQIMYYNPKAIILLDISEFNLFSLERELIKKKSSVEIIPSLGSVLDKNILSRIMNKYNVQTVLHAAAYKHVPMIESNFSFGIYNNVFGTRNVVDAACAVHAETVVLISTDKAVRPTSIMGCSKRLAELILQAKNIELNSHNQKSTILTMVRFGNVLGSSGSVLPIFREQIKFGGPVTVTDPNVVRYFMTIPEASQLVIQAAALGKGGDVMVLDMGEPIKILDLAKRMIHLSGFSVKDETNPDGDIEIKFTGLRPGEKLFEELLISNNTVSTSHPRIMRAMEKVLAPEVLQEVLLKLEDAINKDSYNDIIAILKSSIPEFNRPI